MGERAGESDALSYRPHEGPHEFKRWTVLPDHNGSPWLAPGCTCGVIRSAGKPTESEEAMRLWWETHALEAGHVNMPGQHPTPPPAQRDPAGPTDGGGGRG